MISNKDKNEIYITGSSQYLLLDLTDKLEHTRTSNVPNIKLETKETKVKVKKVLDVIIKEYLALKTFARKNNFFAIISKKIYEIPNFIKKTFKFLGTLKRRFITKAYKKIKKNVLSRFYPKKIIKNLIVNVKKRIELQRPTPIETESFKQTLMLKQAIFKFKLGLGIFNFKRRLIRTRLRHVFYKYDYNYDFEEYKVENRMYRWYYRAKRPRVKSKLWKKLLKKMRFNKKKLFKFIKRFKLIKKLNIFDLILQRERVFPKLLKKTKKKYKILTFVKNIISYTVSNFASACLNFCNMLKKEYTKKTIMQYQTNDSNKYISALFYAIKRRYQLHKQLKLRRAIRVQIYPKTKVIVWGSAGKLGFKSNKRTTPYAAELLGKYLSRYIKRRRAKFINLELSRKVNKKFRAFFKGFNQAGLKLLRVYYKRKIMFGAIRKPKIRRV